MPCALKYGKRLTAKHYKKMAAIRKRKLGLPKKKKKLPKTFTFGQASKVVRGLRK